MVSPIPVLTLQARVAVQALAQVVLLLRKRGHHTICSKLHAKQPRGFLPNNPGLAYPEIGDAARIGWANNQRGKSGFTTVEEAG